eukprot:CAMPEP_0178897742 /NCGR_PEP_ID=MMETSP0786-20121207/1926_1 /TAXON_ID=186022 /ORGANISM="Thalassionema frauenfeldii, Strain CCMP 1798" /LENGTH=170 /DNA_ID=CAMNT_0020568347 /DNA_START=548 /DNA_END=1058 /DNA_ORIENTATION=+
MVNEQNIFQQCYVIDNEGGNDANQLQKEEISQKSKEIKRQDELVSSGKNHKLVVGKIVQRELFMVAVLSAQHMGAVFDAVFQVVKQMRELEATCIALVMEGVIVVRFTVAQKEQRLVENPSASITGVAAAASTKAAEEAHKEIRNPNIVETTGDYLIQMRNRLFSKSSNY